MNLDPSGTILNAVRRAGLGSRPTRGAQPPAST